MSAVSPPREAAAAPRQVIRRFDAYHRVTHVGLMISFLGLAFTGMPLLFSHQPWAARLARLFGGFQAAGILHRTFAVVLIMVFAAHVARVVYRLYAKKEYSMLWGPASMVPQPRDLREIAQHFRWFLGLGPRPVFDHFTYWEKFDYWAVFWGMFIIGGSGLMLWFPAVFSRIVPGWLFNIALLIHGEEALLAVCFIFTIHFFNGHLRPDKFPMDTVIFTGTISEEEFRHERAAEYERLAKAGKLGEVRTPPEPAAVLRWGRVLGTFAVVVGLVMVALILYAFLA